MINDPANSYGFLIRLVTESPTRSLAFCSKDFSDSSKHPQLIITYSCSGATLIKYPIHDAPIGFHDGFSSANTNYETADYFSAFSQPGADYGENAGEALMTFDFTDIPSGSTIVSASLDLFGRGPYGVGDAASIGNVGQNDSYLQRVTSSWDESFVTWNTQPSVTTTNEVTLPASNSAVQDYLGIDVKQLVQDMVDNPITSYGFKIVLQTEDPTRSLAFCSRDYFDSSKFPQLTITYSCTNANGISTIENDEEVIVYPTLTDGMISVKVSDVNGESKAIFKLYDLGGKEVVSIALKASVMHLNLFSVPKGVYVYQVKSVNRMMGHGKIIIQ